jgi:putative transposase
LAERLLDPWPLDRPRGWTKLANQPLRDDDRDRLKISLECGRPLGSDAWTLQMAGRLGLHYTLRSRGWAGI